MKIEIDNRLSPYSHTPGAAALIPGSSWSMRAFPTRLEFENLISREKKAFDLELTGLMENFTLVQDLEKRALIFFGSAKEGYVRLMVTHKDKALQIHAKRTPASGITIGKRTLKPKELLTIAVSEQGFLAPFIENLALGCHKAQDMGLMRRRLELDEILPFWFRLGQLTPATPCVQEEGTLTLLHPIAERIAAKEKLTILEPFKQLFLAGFTDLFVPRLVDEQYQGIAPLLDSPSANLSPLTLLTEGAQLIRSIFFHQKETEMAFLPCLPPDLHAGRMLNIHAQSLLTCDMEWSKKTLRRLIIRPLKSIEIQPIFQKKIKTYRLRASGSDRGSTCKADETLQLKKGLAIWLDHFEK